MRAFVTGANGFVGPWLCRHLAAAGDEVVAIDPAVNITDGVALRNQIGDARPDAVYHLAAQSSVSSSWEDPIPTFEVNVLGTVNVLNAVRAVSPKARVLVVSSVEVYGTVPVADLPITEAAPMRPATPYAASKAAAEMAALQAHFGSGLDVIRARPFNHTGPAQTSRFFVPSMARQIVEAADAGVTELKTGNLAVGREILDVRDVVRAYRLMVDQGAPGEVYNVCSGRSVALAKVLDLMLALAGSDLAVTTDPSRIRPFEVLDLRGDPRHLHDATGWEPEYTLKETLSDVLEYWRTRPSVEA